MNPQNYRRQPGDYEIRFLRDGRIVFVGPNQELLDLAHMLENEALAHSVHERNGHARKNAASGETNQADHV